MIQEIPVSNTVDATFSIELDGNVYKLRSRWNETDQAWFLDLVGVSVDLALYGIKLVSGLDLLAAHGFEELGELWIADFEEEPIDANLDQYGDRFKLLYVTRGS
jgi:hypothetical protein